MHKIHDQIDSEILCNTIVSGMQEIKAENITILDLRDIKSAVCDFFVICSGNSSTHVDGISESLIRFTRKQIQERPWHIEGKNNSEWVLVDYVNVVAHVFYKDIRSFYDLEDLWADAKRTDIKNN